MKRKSLGFTLLELLIVIVIIGILASLAIPRYQKTVESSKGAEAYANLNAIRVAEWEYHNRTGNWVTSVAVVATNFAFLSIEDPNANPKRKFFYSATTSAVPGQFFTLRATREGGPYNLNYIMMDSNGNIDESYWLGGGGGGGIGE